MPPLNGFLAPAAHRSHFIVFQAVVLFLVAPPVIIFIHGHFTLVPAACRATLGGVKPARIEFAPMGV
jgi:hypothetical protein